MPQGLLCQVPFRGDVSSVVPYSILPRFYSPAPMRSNRDREGPHGLPPPTPPYVRVTYTAVRQIQSGWHVHPDRSVLSRGASREFLPDAGQYPPSRRRRSRHSTTGRNSSLPFRPSARSARLLCPLLTSAVLGRIPPPSVLCQDPLQLSRVRRTFVLQTPCATRFTVGQGDFHPQARRHAHGAGARRPSWHVENAHTA